jgi:hypothetical protein
MAQVNELIQHQIGSAPLLNGLIERMGCIPLIDRHLPADPRRSSPPRPASPYAGYRGIVRTTGPMCTKSRAAWRSAPTAACPCAGKPRLGNRADGSP